MGETCFLVAVIACATTALTSCGPPVAGPTQAAALGMTVDAAGNPVIVLQNCEMTIVQLELTGPTAQVLYDNQSPPPAVDEIPLAGNAEWQPNQPVLKRCLARHPAVPDHLGGRVHS